MLKKIVILLSGKMRVGKNQFATFLVDELKSRGHTVEQDLFARGVKDGCKQDFKELQEYLNQKVESINKKVMGFAKNIQQYTSSFGVDMSSFQAALLDIGKEVDALKVNDDNWYENKTDITRRLLQAYGTDIFRKRVDDEYWVKQTKKRAEDVFAEFVIIVDVRFPNEIEGMISDNYILTPIRIERPINHNATKTDEHISETALDGYDKWNYVIENTGSLEDLKGSAYTVVENILNYDAVEV